MTDDTTQPDWHQINVTCADWQSVERVGVTVLRPLLTDARAAAAVTGWWFVRKGPTWRLRLRGSTPEFVGQVITELKANPQVDACTALIYEPETLAFGGPAGMAVAHTWFEADSRHVLDHLAGDATYRRELPTVLAARLMLAAGQDRYEQGDCWARLAEHRTAVGRREPTPDLVTAVRHLTSASDDTDVSPLQALPDWTSAVEHAGRTLAQLAAEGQLQRGLRAVLTQHLLFLFNRHGMSAEDQYLIAGAARRVIFDAPHEPVNTASGTRVVGSDTTTVDAVTTTDETSQAARLRNDLADWIKGRGTFSTPEVEAAFRTVPRHKFLPGIPLETAYGRKPVVTQRAADGSSVSSASSPNLVATMLEQLAVEPGHKVLEIGAATGINAALLAHLAGPAGAVVTIEFDENLAAGAARHLADARYSDVVVIAGDGALGHPASAPYDRLIVTAEAWDVPPAWWDQLTDDGRAVVPLRLHGSGLARSLAFDRVKPNQLVSTSAYVCGFVPMRGLAEHHEQRIQLADEVMIRVEADDLPDEAALRAALAQPRRDIWTGIEVRHDEPADHLDLWLLTNTTSRFGRLAVTAQARADGVDPAMRWAGAALYDGGTIAYVTSRDRDDDTLELGLAVHGPDSGKLTTVATDLLHRWAHERPAEPTVTVHRNDGTGSAAPSAPYLQRPHNTITIAW
jgi:protein-L-isoaspartate(D-aspartate) O-methyltransferase